MAEQTLKRPRKEDTEEDLLEFQKRFLQGNVASSAVIIDKRADKRDAHSSTSHADKDISEGNIEPEKSKKVKFDSCTTSQNDALSSGSFKVVERDTTSFKILPPVGVYPAFPKAVQFHKKVTPIIGSKQSIFAQQMHSQKMKETKTNSNENDKSSVTNNSSDSHSGVGLRSFIIDGSGLTGENKDALVKEIHEENVKKITDMPIEEVFHNQKLLMDTLDPSIVSFLKSKRISAVNSQQKVLAHDSAQSNIRIESESRMEVEDDNCAVSQDSEMKSPTAKTNLKEGEPPIQFLAMPDSEMKSPTDEINLKESELPIQPSVAKQWLHMDKVENDKLAWMTNLPEPVNGKDGDVARFDFEGNIILSGSVIPVHRGLHHHGEEPEQPGYSLEELFRLSQSTLPSQKIVGLTTLSKIISKNHEGYYDEILKRPILPDLVAGYVVPMFRAALDDNNSPKLISVSVATIRSLIVSTPDELSLDETFLWYRGEEQPFSKTKESDTLKDKSEETQTEEELSDITIVDMDIIKGLIRMDLLPRLRYILEIIRPPAPVVVHILEILAKVSRHSLESAKAVMNTPRLLNVIFDEFCPTAWANIVDNQMWEGKLTSLHGIPHHLALKVFRNIASTGQRLAENILSEFNIMTSVLCYLSSGYQDSNLPPKEAMLLCLESLHLWQVFSHYGLNISSYKDFYPLLLQQLHSFQKICINVDADQHSYDCDYAASWIKLLSTLLKWTLISFASFNWEEVVGLYEMIELCLMKWMWEMTTSSVTRAGSRLLATSLNFVATFHKTWSRQISYNKSTALKRIEEVYIKCLRPFISSKLFCDMTNNLRKYSSLGEYDRLQHCRDSTNLLSLNSVLWGGIVAPILERQSPFALLVDLTRCLLVFSKLHSELDDAVEKLVLENPGILSYLNFILSCDNVHTSRCWFSRFETYFLYNLLRLCALKKCNHISGYLTLSLKILSFLHNGDESLLEQLMSTYLFNPEFIKDFDKTAIALDNLRIQDDDLFNSSEITHVSHLELFAAAYQNLPNIGITYKYFLLKHKKSSQEQRFIKSESLCIPLDNVPLVDKDFIFFPLIEIYRKLMKNKAAEAVSPTGVLIENVLHCLQWCHIVECIKKRIGNVSPNQKFCSLSMTFMISPDLFLQTKIKSYLEACFQKMSSKKELESIDLSLSVEEGSFHDYFIHLLDQFEAISYGDHLFGNVILVAMQRCHSVKLRGAVWLERTNALPIIGVTIKELLVPLKCYLEPIEDDSNLLASYFKALLDDRVNAKRNPVLYLIAVHHLHNFLFNEKVQHKALKQSIIKKLLEPKHEVLAHYLQCYSKPDANSELGFICLETPSVRICEIIEMLKSSSE